MSGPFSYRGFSSSPLELPFGIPEEDWLFWWDAQNSDSYIEGSPYRLFDLISGIEDTTVGTHGVYVSSSKVNGYPALTGNGEVNWEGTALPDLDDSNTYTQIMFIGRDGSVTSGEDSTESNFIYGDPGPGGTFNQGMRTYVSKSFSAYDIIPRFRAKIGANNDIMVSASSSPPYNAVVVGERNISAAQQWRGKFIRESVAESSQTDNANGPYSGTVNDAAIQVTGLVDRDYIGEIMLFKNNTISSASIKAYFDAKWGTSFI